MTLRSPSLSCWYGSCESEVVAWVSEGRVDREGAELLTGKATARTRSTGHAASECCGKALSPAKPAIKVQATPASVGLGMSVARIFFFGFFFW